MSPSFGKCSILKMIWTVAMLASVGYPSEQVFGLERDCVWEQWSSYEPCAFISDRKFQMRFRTSTRSASNGTDCKEWGMEYKGCAPTDFTLIKNPSVSSSLYHFFGLNQISPRVGSRGVWTPWSVCTSSCGQNSRIRLRMVCWDRLCKNYNFIDEHLELCEWFSCLCKDTVTWCRNFEKLCNSSDVVRENCRETCGTCGCSWSAWVSTGQCLGMPSGKYGTLRRRNTIETLSGSCEGNATDYVKCNESSFITSTFVASLASALVGKPAKSKGESCSKNIYDSDNKLKLVGNCPLRRSKCDLFQPLNFEKFRTKRQVKINYRDILFLIDESGSMKADVFEKVKELIVAMTDVFCGEVLEIAPSKTRVGITTFSSNPPKIHMRFNDSYDVNVIQENVMSIKYGGGGTCLVDALQKAREDMFRSVNGARVDENRVSLPGTEKFVVLITDGCGNCERDRIPRALENEGILLRHEKISVFTLAIGSTCLPELAKLDEQSTCYTTTDVNTHGGIDEFIFVFKFIKNVFKCLENWPFGNPC